MLLITVFVQPHDMPDLFARASVFVLPSNYEPWGVVIHEALSSGMPVLCSDKCGAAYDLLDKESVNSLFAPGDFSALAKGMKYYSGAKR